MAKSLSRKDISEIVTSDLRTERCENVSHIEIWDETVKSVRLVTQSCPTFCDPVDYSPPGSSVHGDSPGKNTGVGCYALLQGIFPSQGLNPGLPHCRWILSSQRGQQICQVANLNLERFNNYLFLAALLFPTPTIIFNCPFYQMDNLYQISRRYKGTGQPGFSAAAEDTMGKTLLFLVGSSS